MPAGFAFSPATRIKITSLSYTNAFGAQVNHDFSIPSPTPWLGSNAIYNDYYWASGVWSGELLRLEADGPITGCVSPVPVRAKMVRGAWVGRRCAPTRHVGGQCEPSSAAGSQS